MRSEHMEFMGKLKHIVSDQYHGKIINLMISGSHLFGFKSPDSDTDYRGCFQVVTDKLLTTRNIKDNIQYKVMKEGLTKDDIHDKDIFDKDAVLDELGKEVSLLLAGNCNHFEHLFATQLLTSPEHLELKKIFKDQMNLSGIYHSYRGMAHQNYKKFILGGKHTVKKYLYVLRGLMAGTYVLETGKIEPNIQNLVKHFKLDGCSATVLELVGLKKRGMEKDRVNKNLDRYNRVTDEWFERIDKSAEDLPILEWKETEERRVVLDEWLHKTRLGYLDGYQ